MLSNVLNAAWLRKSRRHLAYAIPSLFIVAVVAGLLSAAGCAHTEAGLQREAGLYLVTSNAVQNLKAIVPYAPPPANSLLEGVLACGGALLALWATHLHRSVNQLKNGNAAGPKESSPGVPPKPTASAQV